MGSPCRRCAPSQGQRAKNFHHGASTKPLTWFLIDMQEILSLSTSLASSITVVPEKKTVQSTLVATSRQFVSQRRQCGAVGSSPWTGGRLQLFSTGANVEYCVNPDNTNNCTPRTTPHYRLRITPSAWRESPITPDLVGVGAVRISRRDRSNARDALQERTTDDKATKTKRTNQADLEQARIYIVRRLAQAYGPKVVRFG